MSPLNPYFLQGSPSEQRLVQDLINEQLKMYGQDIVYLPRKIINQNTIIKEITASKFDDNYRLEAYITNFEGFGGQGDILSKFGVRTTDELTLLISKDRYENFITPFLSSESNVTISNRPEEGDLIYLPIDNTIFEIKYVEGKKPFYQLNNLYIYELRCEVFEYEDEIIDTTIEEVDNAIKDFGYIQTLQMVGLGATQARAQVSLASSQIGSPFGKSVYAIDLINDGAYYLSTPTILISNAFSGGINATAVAIMTSKTGRTGFSVDRILVINPGIGYTTIPTVNIISDSGTGAIATAILGTGSLGPVVINSGGVGYGSTPIVSISTAPSGGINAVAEALLNTSGIVTSIRYTTAGIGYTQSPTITISSPAGISTGNYVFNEVVKGVSTGTSAYVKNWDNSTSILKVSITDGYFAVGETVVGMGTTAGGSNSNYTIQKIYTDDLYDKYSENAIIQSEANEILDFSEGNPFGNY
jgi:hypothetical protein